MKDDRRCPVRKIPEGAVNGYNQKIEIVDALATAQPGNGQQRVAQADRVQPQPPVNVGSVAIGEPVHFALDKTYPQHFEEQVRRTPDAVAIRYRRQDVTYAELNRRANQLAHHLRAMRVGPESLVAVCLERSPEFIVAMLAIWKAGGAYLPLDRSYPKERIAYMLADSRASLLLTRTVVASDLKMEGVKVVCLDDPAQVAAIEGASSENPPPSSQPDNLVYVIYTSGSTGNPKGVEITQRSLLNHNFAVAKAYDLRADDRVLQFSPVSFDISVEEIFPSLLRGCAIVLRDDEVLSATAKFMEFVARERLTVLNLPTAYWHEVVDYLQTALMPPSVRLVVIGGEKASDEAWRRWKFRVGEAVKLINTYGPTETTVIATLHAARLDDDSLPIGRPLPNVETAVLDANLKPVAIGETGELFIGGIGVARGYLNRPELTAEKFVQHCVSGLTASRFYRTGDLVRMRKGGVIEFIGRADEQVKIRGFRIELGEIEAALRSHCWFERGDCCIARGCGRTEETGRLLCPAGGRQFERERAFRLPESETSGLYGAVGVCAIGHRADDSCGKWIAARLPEPGRGRPELSSRFVAPRTPMEEVIARIWEQVLGLEGIGVEDNFFDLGGHSLLATQVIAQIRETLQMETPVTVCLCSRPWPRWRNISPT